jgi:hypothetical protein
MIAAAKLLEATGRTVAVITNDQAPNSSIPTPPAAPSAESTR